ncbi:MAG: peptidylprolyl isomerase [Candidatus Aenigmarchaeota archaeon]|nr:peptidylprolyl isomerase [Candidatus Aenigmarchaeota archaeon]
MEKGDFVKIEYVGRLESGEIFDLTREDVARKEKIYNEKMKYGPVSVVIGSGFVLPGLENALVGMTPGDKKTITIEPADGFGQRNADMVKTVNSKVFGDKNVDPQPGMIVDFSGLKGRIQSVSSGRVTVDFNNPLAGKKLIYDVEVKEKIEKADEQIKSLLQFFGFQASAVMISNGVADIEADLPAEIKSKIAETILKNVKPDGKKLQKVRFIQAF